MWLSPSLGRAMHKLHGSRLGQTRLFEDKSYMLLYSQLKPINLKPPFIKGNG